MIIPNNNPDLYAVQAEVYIYCIDSTDSDFKDNDVYLTLIPIVGWQEMQDVMQPVLPGNVNNDSVAYACIDELPEGKETPLISNFIFDKSTHTYVELYSGATYSEDTDDSYIKAALIRYAISQFKPQINRSAA